MKFRLRADQGAYVLYLCDLAWAGYGRRPTWGWNAEPGRASRLHKGEADYLYDLCRRPFRFWESHPAHGWTYRLEVVR